MPRHASRPANISFTSHGQPPAVTILINGQPQQVAQTLTVAQLLEQFQIPLRGVAVEVNFEIVPRNRHAERWLADGDRLEIVSLVGGG